MANPSPTFRLATPADAAALAALGARTFRDTFGPDNRPEDMDAYVAETYSLEATRRDLEDPHRQTLLAELGGTLVAFAQLREGEPPDCVGGDAPLEILRFYVDRPWHGQGIAQALMNQCIALARARSARTLWLAVWEHNHRAKAFYAKHGFVDVGSKTFVLGADHQTDRVMTLALSPAADSKRARSS